MPLEVGGEVRGALRHPANRSAQSRRARARSATWLRQAVRAWSLHALSPLVAIPRRAHVFNTAIIVFMISTVAIERPANWPAAVPFAAAGAACVVAGGLVAAATALAPSQLASWTTAYLVLVGGVAQAALGAGQALLTARPPGRPGIAAELTAWNAGNGAVLAGTLLGASWLADVGGVLLAAVLALMIAATRGAARQPAWPVHLYRALAALVLVSIPAGLVIAGLRPH